MVSLAFTWGSIAFYRFLDSGVGSSRLSQHSFHNVAFTCALWRVHFVPLRSCKKLKWGPHPALGPYVVFVGFKEERRDKCGLFPTFLVSIACKLNRMSHTIFKHFWFEHCHLYSLQTPTRCLGCDGLDVKRAISVALYSCPTRFELFISYKEGFKRIRPTHSIEMCS